MMRQLLIMMLLAAVLGVSAQEVRDPTAEPPQATGGLGGPGEAQADMGALSVIVVDGRPHVIMGTRLYAPGQKLGQARIERITETEIWLREGGVLRKVSRYQGIERRSVPASGTPGCATGAVSAKAASKNFPRSKPCTDAQP